MINKYISAMMKHKSDYSLTLAYSTETSECFPGSTKNPRSDTSGMSFWAWR